MRRLISGDEREGGRAGTNRRGPAVRKGGPTLLDMFCLSGKYYYLSISQINPFKPRIRNSANEG